MMTIGKRLSVVILSYNGKRDSLRCLDSFVGTFDFNLDEIIVVDNGSTDSTFEALSVPKYAAVKLVRSEKNIGLSPGRNLGASHAQGRYLMMLDNDTVNLNEGPLGGVVEDVFQSEPNIGVVGFQLFNDDQSVQNSCRRFPIIIQPFLARISRLQKLSQVKRYLEHHLMADIDYRSFGNRLEAVDYVLGACQCFKRVDYDLIAGYDNKIFYGTDDVEFCFRMKKMGRKNVYSAKLKFYHLYMRRSKTNYRLLYFHIKSFFYMFLKHLCLWRLKP